MGLDTVELVMAFEEEFGITIENQDAAKIRTPGDVVEYVFPRVRTSKEAPCHSQAAFHRIRALLMSEFNVPRKEISPSSRLEDLVMGNRSENWKRLGKAIGTDNFPRLQRTALFFWLVVIGVPGLVAGFLAINGFSVSVWLLTFLVVVVTANQATWKMGTKIPSKYERVGSLLPYVGCTSSTVWNRDTILQRVIAITSEQLGVQKEEIHEHSRFVDDLGAD